MLLVQAIVARERADAFALLAGMRSHTPLLGALDERLRLHARMLARSDREREDRDAQQLQPHGRELAGALGGAPR